MGVRGGVTQAWMGEGVVNELEQAEARLGDARESVDHAVTVLSGYEFHGMNFNDRVGVRKQYYDALVELQVASIEVGRLRAIAEVEPLVEAARAIDALADFAQVIVRREVEPGPFTRLKAALAAREEAS